MMYSNSFSRERFSGFTLPAKVLVAFFFFFWVPGVLLPSVSLVCLSAGVVGASAEDGALCFLCFFPVFLSVVSPVCPAPLLSGVLLRSCISSWNFFCAVASLGVRTCSPAICPVCGGIDADLVSFPSTWSPSPGDLGPSESELLWSNCINMVRCCLILVHTPAGSLRLGQKL